MSRSGMHSTPDGKAIGLEQIPMAWSDTGDKVYSEVELPSGSAEFNAVSAYFRKTAHQLHGCLCKAPAELIPLATLYGCAPGGE